MCEEQPLYWAFLWLISHEPVFAVIKLKNESLCCIESVALRLMPVMKQIVDIFLEDRRSLVHLMQGVVDVCRLKGLQLEEFVNLMPNFTSKSLPT